MKQILIVEDDELLNKMLVYNLHSESYGIVSVETVKEAMEVLKSQPFDLVLLDINLPDGNGYEIAKTIRDKYSDTIVIFLTANDRESDEIRGYELGAVDYITKPFSIHSLQRKVENVLRMMRHHVAMQDVFDDGRLFLNFAEQTAMLGGKPLTLSTLEFRMLNLFCQNRNRVLTRKQLLEKIWDCTENYVDEHTLTTTLSRIRGKIETDGTVYIKTVYGMGYKWTGVKQHDRKENLCKKDVFLDDCRHGILNDSNHIALLLSDQKYRSVMGWAGINSLRSTVDAFYGTTVGNETVKFYF